MKRLLLVGFMIVAFTFSTAAVVSAAPMSPTTATGHSWIGKTTNDLLIQMGTPNYTVRNNDGGQALDYVMHKYIGRGGTIDYVQQFNVDGSGKITSERVRQM